MRDGCNDGLIFTQLIHHSEWEAVDKSPPEVANDYASGLGMFSYPIESFLDLIDECLTKAALFRFVKSCGGCEFLRSLWKEL